MRRAYLLAYSNAFGSRDQIKSVVNTMAEVVWWRYDMPNAFYIISEATADTLAAALKKGIGNNGRFIITEITDNSQGWLTPDSWYLIQNKSGREK